MRFTHRLTGLWWLALAVLLVNDHLLKGAGLLPLWATGKLSDFAGLVVLPVLLVKLLRVRNTAGAAALFVGVAGVFSVINLFPAASSVAEAVAARLGIGLRLWPDPSDLIALASLPVAWRVCQAGEVLAPRAPAASRLPFWVERGGVILGAVACMATSLPRSGLSVRNPSEAELVVTVYEAPVTKCDLVNIPPQAFDRSTCQRIDGEPLHVDAHSFPRGGVCGAFLVVGERLAPTVVIRRGREKTGQKQVTLVKDAAGYRLDGGTLVDWKVPHRCVERAPSEKK